MEIKIITPNGAVRNQSLLKILPNVQVVVGIDGRDPNFKIPKEVDQSANKLIYGVKLATTQIAATLSHRKAQLEFHERWCCLLEDDAIIMDVAAFKKGLQAIEDNFDDSKPIIILLHLGYGGVFSATKVLDNLFGVMKVRVLPTGAVAYCLNSAAQQVVKDLRKIVGVPDWPTWTSNVAMFSIVPPLVVHDPEFESIYASRTPTNHSTIWPAHRTSAIRAIRGYGNRKLILAYGGAYSYTKNVVLPGIYRKFARKLN